MWSLSWEDNRVNGKTLLVWTNIRCSTLSCMRPGFEPRMYWREVTTLPGTALTRHWEMFTLFRTPRHASCSGRNAILYHRTCQTPIADDLSNSSEPELTPSNSASHPAPISLSLLAINCTKKTRNLYLFLYYCEAFALRFRLNGNEKRFLHCTVPKQIRLKPETGQNLRRIESVWPSCCDIA